MIERSARGLHTIVVCAALVVAASPLGAATFPNGFVESALVPAGTLPNGTAMQFAPDGRLFVAQQTGQLRVVENGVLLTTPFVTLGVDSSGERGLLGVAFDPNFAANHFVYVYYTVPSPSPGVGPHNRVSRFTANGNEALAGSELPILDLEPLSATNHNGGAINFGPDGKLYVAVGENANGSNSQSLANRLGKMLRINANGSIPNDNPTTFSGIAGSPTGANRAIWAVGLRNPYTFAFNPGGPAPAMLINDVGQSTWEEVNDGSAGANYGWPTSEGGVPANAAFVDPRHRYGHGSTSTTGCAITGGAFYNPATQTFPSDYLNDYFFADVCTGWIRRLDTSTNVAVDFATGAGGPVDLKVWSDGNLYYLSRGNGTVYRVRFTGAVPTPAPTGLAAQVSGSALRLSWSPAAGAVSYRLEAGSATGQADLVNTDLGNVTSFDVAAPVGTFFVRVRAVHAAGLSGPSNQVTVVVASAASCTSPPPVPTGYGAQSGGLLAALAWAPSFNASAYLLEVGLSTGATSFPVSNLGNVTSFQAVAPAGTYFTRIRAANACGMSAPSTELPITLGCGPTAVVPTGLAVSRAGGVAIFTWQAPLGATGYRMQIGSAHGATNLADVAVGAVALLPVTVGGVPAGTYYVRIVAVSACGVSAPSNEVTITLP
ncbi:MAG: PQQ-dependent sugar dehydrogenase [Acidobacteriota bacterium]